MKWMRVRMGRSGERMREQMRGVGKSRIGIRHNRSKTCLAPLSTVKELPASGGDG